MHYRSMYKEMINHMIVKNHLRLRNVTDRNIHVINGIMILNVVHKYAIMMKWNDKCISRPAGLSTSRMR